MFGKRKEAKEGTFPPDTKHSRDLIWNLSILYAYYTFFSEFVKSNRCGLFGRFGNFSENSRMISRQYGQHLSVYNNTFFL